MPTKCLSAAPRRAKIVVRSDGNANYDSEVPVNATAEGVKFVPPYISFRTLLHLIERMADDGTPPRIDRTFLSGSEGSKTQVLAALRSLKFIDTDGNVTTLLAEIVKNPSSRAPTIKQLLETFYPEPVQLGSINATQGQLEDAFRAYGIKGDTMRKAVAFYLRAAEFSGVPVSPNFKTPSIQRADGTPTRKTAPKRTAPTARRSAVETEDDGVNLPQIHPGLVAVLADLPTHGRSWTSEAKTRWMLVFETMIDYAIPITDEDAEPADEAEDYDPEDDETLAETT